MTYLPFKTYNKQEVETYPVTDSNGNIINVPKHGWITWQENYKFSQYTLEAGDDISMSIAAYDTEVVALFLRLRFNIPEDVSKEEILVYPDGSPFSQSMIDELSKFFKNERTRWKEVSTNNSTTEKSNKSAPKQ